MTDDEYAAERFRTAKPRQLEVKPLEMSNFYPAKTRHHLLGAVGEGGDKSIPHDVPADPIINNQPSEAAGASAVNKQIIIIDDDLVARYYKIYAVLVGDVP